MQNLQFSSADEFVGKQLFLLQVADLKIIPLEAED